MPTRYLEFGVRAFNRYGMEEQNLDCGVTIVLDASGNDITQRPMPPTALRAFATAAGGIRVEWAYNTINPDPIPTGFHVYVGTGGTPELCVPAATVSFFSAIAGTFVANLAGLTGHHLHDRRASLQRHRRGTEHQYRQLYRRSRPDRRPS